MVDDYNSRNDTTLNYTRKGLAANYQAAVSSGSPIYTLYFHTIKSDYKHLLQNNNMAELVPNGGYTYSATFSDAFINGYHTHRSPGSKIMPYAYLFCDYEPNDSAMYRIGTVLPPVCYLGLDRDNDADKVRLPEYQLYDVFSRELVTLDRAVRDTRVPTQRPKMSCNGGKEFCGGTSASKVWQYNWNSNTKVRNVSTAFTNGLVEVSPGSLWFKHLELRVVMDNNIWTNMNSNTRAIRYYNDGVINRYPAATLLWFKEDSRKKRIDSTYFYGMMNDAPTHAPSTIVFYDEATSTILNDLELMAKLFNRIVGAGRYMHASAYSKKSSEADFILNRPNNRLAVPSGVPVTIPKSVLHCWYFNALNATVTANITDKKELTFKNVGTISRYKMRQYSDVGNMVYSWQDHVVHYNTMPYEMDRTRGTISEEGLLWNKTKYKSSRDVWWDYQGLITSQAIDKYRMFYNVRNARVYTYWRTLNSGNILSRVVSAVRTREDGERIFLATDRRTNPDFSYSYTLGSTLITTYEKYSYINSYWSDKTNWFEK